jgi:anti-sigma factor RsiW
MRTEVEGDLTVVRWLDTSYDYALVGSLPREELERIASSART